MKNSHFAFLKLLILIFSLSLTLPLHANQQAEFDEEIVVTATKIPLAISEAPGLIQTIDQEEIKENNTQSVADFLNNRGFTVSTQGGDCSVATIRLDGVAANQTVILIDGVPVQGGTLGEVDLSYLPLVGVEKIEVVNGPLSALYGANALGGVVNIIPELTGAPKFLLNLSGGSFSSGRAGMQIKSEDWGLTIGGNTTKGHRPHSATEGFHLSAQYNLAKLHDDFLKIYSGYRTKNAQIPGSFPGNQTDENFFLNLSGKKGLGVGYGEGKLFYQTWDNSYEDLTMNTQDSHLSQRWGTDLSYCYEGENHRLLNGLSYYYDTFKSTTTGDHQRHEVGVYLQDLWDLNDYLLLHSGLRWDQIADLSALSPRIGVIGFLSDRLNLGINIGAAFRAPTINDLYYTDLAWNSYGNPNLKPEKGHKLEVTGNWRSSRSSLSANLFQSHLNDGIVWTFADGKYMPENIDKLKTTGFNLRSEHNWGPVITSIGYTFLNKLGWDAQTKKYNRDLNVFGQHRLNLKARATLGKFNVKTGCQFIANRNQQKDENWQDVAMPDYALFSVGLQYKFNDVLSCSLDAENITNAVYEIHKNYPMPKRNFQFNLSYHY